MVLFPHPQVLAFDIFRYLCGMKRLKSYYLHYRYRRLWHKLFWLYAQKHQYASAAYVQAQNAFTYLVGSEFRYEYYDAPTVDDAH